MKPAIVAMIKFIIELIQLIVSVLLIYGQSLKNLLLGKPKKNISGQVALVTGAGHGLGRELAIQLAGQGAKVALLDINKDNCDSVCREISKSGGIVKSYHCDVTKEEMTQSVVRRVAQDLGAIDILVNNAGITHCRPFIELNSQQIRKTFEVNTFSHFWSISAVLPEMIKRNHGHIVAISSIAGLLGTANVVEYCASKFAVNGLMVSLEKELHADGANDGIHFTTICPLIMNTGMFKKPKTRFSSLLPICNAEDVARSTLKAILRNDSMITVPESAMAIYRIEK